MEEYNQAIKELTIVAQRIIERSKDTIAELEETMKKTTDLLKQRISPDSIGRTRFKQTQDF